MALCITKNGLKAIDVEDEATAAPKGTSVLRHAPAREAEKCAPKAIASRKQISVAAQKSRYWITPRLSYSFDFLTTRPCVGRFPAQQAPRLCPS
jgi:hypothetical protein